MNRGLAFGLMAIVLGATIFFILFEIGLRIAFFRSMDFDIEMWKYATNIKQEAADPTVGHEHTPGAEAFLMGVNVKINELKLREKPYGHAKPKGVKRVLMLGDSITFGWGVPFKETTSKLLEKRLNDSGSGPWQVINAGVGNYNTSQEVSYFFNEGYRYDADVVILNYFINDAEPTPRSRGIPFLNWSYAYIYLKGRLDVLGRQAFNRQNWEEYYLSLYAEDGTGWLQVINSMEKLAAYCRENNLPLIIAHYPELHDLKTYRFTKVRDDLKATAERIGATFVDLLDAVKGQNETVLWVDPADPHPNGRANRLFSMALAPAVLATVSGQR